MEQLFSSVSRSISSTISISHHARHTCIAVALMTTAIWACGGDGDGPPDSSPDSSSAVIDAAVPSNPAAPAALEPYSEGACPTLVDGAQSFRSAGRDRTLQVSLPSDPSGAGLLFMWHGNGDNAANFHAALGGPEAAESEHLIVVAPDNCCGNGILDWPVGLGLDPGPDETLFDDLIACTSSQFGIDTYRVYTTGFSAGGLWSSRLLMVRSEYLAGAVIFSGGTDAFVNTYMTPLYDVPVILLHGGTWDQVVFSFQAITESFAASLVQDGHTVVLCNHGLGHMVPPGFAAWSWPFLSAHRFGQPSPYAGSDPSGALPDYCTFP